MTSHRQKMTLLVLLLRASVKRIATTGEWIDTVYLDNHSPAICQQLQTEMLIRRRVLIGRDEVYELSEQGRVAANEYLAASRVN